MLKNSKVFLSFSVNDLNEAKNFYSSVLGLNVTDDPEMEGILNLNISGDNTILIYPKPDHQPATFTILNFQVLNLEKVVGELKEKGIQFENYKEASIKTDPDNINRSERLWIAWFKDPAGNILSVLESK